MYMKKKEQESLRDAIYIRKRKKISLKRKRLENAKELRPLNT